MLVLGHGKVEKAGLFKSLKKIFKIYQSGGLIG
jgi:hypothetical protein